MLRALRHFGSLYSVARNPEFARLTAEDLAFFRSILPPAAVLTENLDPFATDWMRIFKGSPSVVLKPKTTAEVSAILKHCNARRLAVCPQGGNTDLVGASVPVHDEVVLSLKGMNRILELNESQATVRCEAGVVLGDLHTHCKSKGLIVPLDLGAKGSCCIGGNVSTNAGGIRYLRYGSLHGSVLGLEVVLANGEVLDSMNSMRKDNTGYDLKQLFIGSEGTLGVVTKVALQLAPKPKAVNAVFMSCTKFETVVQLLGKARSMLGEILSAYEFLDRGSLELVLKHVPMARYPFPVFHPFYLLIETHGSNLDHDQEKLNNFLQETLEEHPDMQGVVSQDEKQLDSIWTLREFCADVTTKEGYCFSYDLGLPLHNFYSVVEAAKARVGDRGITVGYGHIADCNIHLNVVVTDHSLLEEVQSLLEPFVYDYTIQAKGSISAEHGIGLQKRSKLPHAKSETQMRFMVRCTQTQLKTLFDPKGILNPYKVL